MSKSMMDWCCFSFAELSNGQLYELLALRTEVFVVEQDCPYQDLDGLDQQAWHLCGYADNVLVAYLRLLAPGVKYKEASIGRVIAAPAARGRGLGRELMCVGLHAAHKHYPAAGVRLSAQAHLQAFYASLGFIAVGSEYLEDNIPHIEMVLAAR